METVKIRKSGYSVRVDFKVNTALSTSLLKPSTNYSVCVIPQCICTVHTCTYVYTQDFYEKYQFLIGPESADLGAQVSTFLTGLGFGSEHFQIGKTKVNVNIRFVAQSSVSTSWCVVCCLQVFMREKQKQALQTELGDKVLAKIVIIQRWIRAKMLRCRFLHARRSATMIQVHLYILCIGLQCS